MPLLAAIAGDLHCYTRSVFGGMFCDLYQEKQSAELAPLPDGVAQVVLPEDRARNMTVKTGFSYFLVTMNFYEGAKVGLYLKHFRNQVIVSRTEEASLAGESLQMLDRIVDVDGIPVSDKDVCKTLIVRALHLCDDDLISEFNNKIMNFQATGSVSMLVERPVDEAAKDLMTTAIEASVHQEPSAPMASDVKSIVRRYKEKLEGGHGAIKPVKILVHPKAAKNQRERAHVRIGSKQEHVIIGADNEKNIDNLQV
ncbi:unnamed protein product [Nippostrongylus brasiliensis]|uniref:PDZ domain-containing protein n=1 Tax=Nippostrongylus brasiliensis TaxID=27835 RepID=A0A0N4YIQ7_NIPBR|nr:unnamed protein product [Nippostrongylus brasiliensis]